MKTIWHSSPSLSTNPCLFVHFPVNTKSHLYFLIYSASDHLIISITWGLFCWWETLETRRSVYPLYLSLGNGSLHCHIPQSSQPKGLHLAPKDQPAWIFFIYLFIFNGRTSLHLSRLIFADNLFALSGADESSFRLVTYMMSNFYYYYLMQRSRQCVRTSCWLWKVVSCETIKELGEQVTADCFKKRFSTRIQSRFNKLVSYWGRGQRISSVLFSNLIYCAPIFIMPQKV